MLYWLVFLGCTGLSFAGGFWFTYRYTSQINVRGPQTAVAPPDQELQTPAPLETPQPIATPQDLFAAAPIDTPMPTPMPVETPEPRPTPPPMATRVRPEQAPIETPAPLSDQDLAATPEPTLEDVYRVQVGSYDTREDADAMVQELLDAGIEAVVVFDRSKYHAQVGAYNSKERALAVADEVNAKGYAVTIRH